MDDSPDYLEYRKRKQSLHIRKQSSHAQMPHNFSLQNQLMIFSELKLGILVYGEFFDPSRYDLV